MADEAERVVPPPPAPARAAAANEADGGGCNGAGIPMIPHLPAPLLGGIFDFLDCSDVRSAILAGRSFSKDVSESLETLSICRPSELDVPFARRFINVKSVNIFCLFEFLTRDEDQKLSQHLIPEATGRIVPFLQTFPKLKRVFVGGRLWIRERYFVRRTFNLYDCSSPKNHENITSVLQLQEAFCGAFKSRSLSQELRVIGITHRMHKCYLDPENENVCPVCREMCATFPPKILMGLRRSASPNRGNITMSAKSFYKTLNMRRDGHDIISVHMIERLDHLIVDELACYYVFGKKDFMDWLQEQGRVWEVPMVLFYEEETLTDLEELAKYGFDPTTISIKDLVRKMLKQFSPSFSDSLKKIGEDESEEQFGRVVFCKSSFDRLTSMGFSLDTENDFFIVDDTSDPVLQRLLRDRA